MTRNFRFRFSLQGLCFCAAVFLCFYPESTVWAAPGKSARGAGSRGFGLGGALFVGSGPGSSADGAVASRDLSNLGVALQVGWRFSWIEPLLFAEYEHVNQTTESSSVNNQNLGGSGAYLGLGVKFRVGSTFLGLGYDFPGNYKLSRKTTAGEESTYSDMTGYQGQIGYQSDPHLGIFLFYRTRSFSRVSLNSTIFNISGAKLKFEFFGAGITSEIF